MHFSGRLIKVTVYPDRLALRMFLLGEYTIHGSEIRSIADGRRRRQVIIKHAAPGRASPVVLDHPPDDLRRAIEQIRRDPVASSHPPTPDTPTDRAARNIAWNLTTFMYVAGLVLSIGFVAFGATQLIHAPNLFTIAFVGIGLVSSFQCARELMQQTRQD